MYTQDHDRHDRDEGRRPSDPHTAAADRRFTRRIDCAAAPDRRMGAAGHGRGAPEPSQGGGRHA